jgi:hypothetical protein
MFVRNRLTATSRRGVVLILVLGMLGLLALIGVAFATFSGQAQYSARIYSQKLATPDFDELTSFALEQLVNDTSNPLSAIRGHSLLRDMYGNDASTNGYLDRVPYSGADLTISAVKVTNDPTGLTPGANAYKDQPYQYVIDTNIPAFLSSYNFLRWIVRLQATWSVDQSTGDPYYFNVSQTFEVTGQAVNGNTRQLAISGSHAWPVPNTTPPASTIAPTWYTYTNPKNTAKTIDAGTTPPVQNVTFVLDGRHLRAFNGPGMTNAAQYGNFRLNGALLQSVLGVPIPDPYRPQLGDANAVGADEDYDAPDLENWFLGLQSADGQVVIPSFHRPGILATHPNLINPTTNQVETDWSLDPQNYTTGTPQQQLLVQQARAKILRPRAVDHPASGGGLVGGTFPDLVPGADGKVKYDVDNDGDGVTDSVWLDLGHPVQRDATGRLYKPLYSFMVLGLNGRLPLNTVGNLNARAPANLNDATNTPVVFEGDPTYDHASHLGASPSEINPRYALQNADDLADDFSMAGKQADAANPNYRQFDNATVTVNMQTYLAGVQVNLTQLRNLLTGARLPDTATNYDRNRVLVDGQGMYLPNNVADDVDGTTAVGGQTIVPRKSGAVVGRWGEVEAITGFLGVPSSYPVAAGTPPRPQTAATFNSIARAGRSPVRWVDGTDDNFDALDFYPLYQAGVTGGEVGNMIALDRGTYIEPSVGQTLLPSERIRRFLTPIDPTGNGLILPWDGLYDPVDPYGLGTDQFGRVSFFHYFRPPGVPIDDLPVVQVSPGPPAVLSAPLAKNRLNEYHGYESYRNPLLGPNNAGFRAAMPYDRNNLVSPSDVDANGNLKPPTDLFDAAGTTYLGTYGPSINSAANLGNPALPARRAVPNAFALGSLTWNNPDEMNPYQPSEYDAPFGPTDLEWLYRQQDIDGTSLSSRLADLAPVSFLNKRDGLFRRRLFSTDSWERTNFVFAHDNPDGAAFSNNSRFPAFNAANSAAVNATLAARPDLTNASLLTLDNLNSPAQPAPYYYAPTGLSPTPAIAHGDRKINLNFPLPHSHNPREPVRQKWIAETYALLKTILPPQAVDTSEELAALSQFVVNIIDFRDPDNSVTIFTNHDIELVPAQVDTTTPLPTFTPPKIQFSTATTTNYLEQYGMEYNPIALNEVLGLQYNYADPAKAPAQDRNAPVNRLIIELVNTLTRDATGGNSPPTPANHNPSDLDLKGWDFVLAKEDPAADPTLPNPCFHPTFVRPDPTTGQIPQVGVGTHVFSSPIAGQNPSQPAPAAKQAVPVVVASGKKISLDPTTGLPKPVPADFASGLPFLVEAIDASAPKYFTIGGRRFAGSTTGLGTLETGVPNPTQSFGPNTWDLIPDTNDPAFTGGTRGAYFWLYLRRPANPFADLDLNPASPTYNPMVVVDSIRFPFSGSKGAGKTIQNPMTNKDVEDQEATPPNGQDNYSVGRPQPYRGGQLVHDTSDATNKTPLFAYGTSEQALPSTSGGGRGIYDILDPALKQVQTTGAIHQTLGAANDNADVPWDHLVFHDRDFTSVAELLLVPGSPPGLFTKQFAEEPPPIPVPVPAAFNPRPPTSQPSGDGFTQQFKVETPHPFPYLVDKFYYTADNTNPTPAVVGGPGGAGWHRILEFFEVPSPVLGAIGPIEQGVNFDWYREDLRPGLINLNLIIDEEVFFGIIDDPRLNLALDTTGGQVPQVVTQIDTTGKPVASYPMSDLTVDLAASPPAIKYPYGRGFTYFVDATGKLDLNPTPASIPVSGMKAAFADFLKLRHGGSGFLYAHGSGPAGTPFLSSPPATTDDPRVAVDRPFRSLSFPDINYTVMRPATLQPSAYTYPPLDTTKDVINPGLKNPDFPVGIDGSGKLKSDGAGTLVPRTMVPQVPPIPPRRLFAVPDTHFAAIGTEYSNASLPGRTRVLYPFPPDVTNPPANYPGVVPYVPTHVANKVPYIPAVDAATQNNFPYQNPPSSIDTATPYASLVQNTTGLLSREPFLGGLGTTPGDDHRRHPYFRTEMLQKIMNLTTVRTHQYAVWVTVGFFEVTQPGNALLAIPDQLGSELDALNGRSVRYRSFSILDRSRAAGFNPSNPGNFHDVVVYHRRIE